MWKFLLGVVVGVAVVWGAQAVASVSHVNETYEVVAVAEVNSPYGTFNRATANDVIVLARQVKSGELETFRSKDLGRWELQSFVDNDILLEHKPAWHFRFTVRPGFIERHW